MLRKTPAFAGAALEENMPCTPIVPIIALP